MIDREWDSLIIKYLHIYSIRMNNKIKNCILSNAKKKT